MVSTSSLTMMVEAVTYALRLIASKGDSQTTQATILTLNELARKSGMGSLDRQRQCLTSTLENLCGCTGMKGNDGADRWAKQPSQWLASQKTWSVEELETQPVNTVLKHHTISCLLERGLERGSAQWSSLKGQEWPIVNQMNTGTVASTHTQLFLTFWPKNWLWGKC